MITAAVSTHLLLCCPLRAYHKLFLPVCAHTLYLLPYLGIRGSSPATIFLLRRSTIHAYKINFSTDGRNLSTCTLHSTFPRKLFILIYRKSPSI